MNNLIVVIKIFQKLVWLLLFIFFCIYGKILSVSDRSEDRLDDKLIKSLIETTLEEKMMKNTEFIRYSFYELRVKYNLSEQDTDRFLELIRTKLQNENYKVYFTGTRFKYKDAKMKVQYNELMIAVKEEGS